MIDHMNLPVRDMNTSRVFYDTVLDQLGITVLAEDGDAVGYGDGIWAFGLVPAAGRVEPLHLAFKAASRENVDGFYDAALAAGGVSNGKPGPRPEYGDGYYACFVTDPDGHNIEAVFRG